MQTHSCSRGERTRGGRRLAASLLLALAGLLVAASASAQLVISEFRLRGVNGANDEFIELVNNLATTVTISATSGAGFGVAASDGFTRCLIPNGTILPPGGHFLCVNSNNYSLSGYPSGGGTTATSNASYSIDILDNAGIALFNNNSGGASYNLANRLDAVGSAVEENTLYKEGTGLPVLGLENTNQSFYRDTCGKMGGIAVLGACPSAGAVIDTNDNASNFIYVDTNGTANGAGQRLGGPAPQNLASPTSRGSTIANARLDASTGTLSARNFVRSLSPDAPNNSPLGTISLRRRFTNNTGGNLTRLRFRIIDQSTFPAPFGIADLRARTSSLVVVAGINDAATCAATGSPATPPCTVSVQGTTLETPPALFNGGAFNSSMSAGTVTLATPIANGASINLQFLFGVQQNGIFKVALQIEALPLGGGLFEISDFDIFRDSFESP